MGGSPDPGTLAMISISTRGRKTVAALLAAATLGVAAAPSEANAGGWKGKHHHGHGHGHGYGYGAAALGGGLLLGAIIASNGRSGYARECWIERRKRVDAYGYVYVGKVRICD